MNEVIMAGRLATDVTVRSTGNGTKVANYRIAVDKRFKREGEQTANFFSCVTFGKRAEFAEKYLSRGTKIIIRGELENDNYQDKDGKMVYRDIINVQSQEFCESKKTADANRETTASAAPAAAPVKSDVDENGFMNIPDGLDEELPFA